MFLTITGPLGHKERGVVDNAGYSLGELFASVGEIQAVFINGSSRDDWKSFIPTSGDRVEVFGPTGVDWISAIVMIAVSLALQGITRALTPKPKKPKAGNRQEAFGVSGYNNTAGPGTPAFVPYGQNRVWGHVIASGASLSPDGRQMYGRSLYFMGDTGGDGVQSFNDLLIDKSPIANYPEISYYTRSGLDAQAVIPEFENVDNLFFDGRPLPFNSGTMTGTPIIYTTKSALVNRATLFFNFAAGLFRINAKGGQRQAGVDINIEIKPNASGSFAALPLAQYSDNTTSGKFFTYQIDFPNAGKWDIRVTTISWAGFVSGEAFTGDVSLFNVQETQFTNETYPGWALVGLTNIPANKIRSLEGMEFSALMEGKRVKVPDGLGNTTLVYTRQRCWIVRDMMTNRRVGMGNEIDESEIDDAQWIQSQAYYDSSATGHSGLEPRDLADFLTNDSDWDWEWIRKVAGEGRGRLIPSGNKWKYVIDAPGTPNILYAEGANIMEGSVALEISHPDRPFNQIIAGFRDADKDYLPNFAPPITDPDVGSAPIVQEWLQYDTITRESEVQRENMIVLKRALLERRKWAFFSPLTAIVSEPMDLDYLAERSIGGEGSYSGFLPPGSSATVVPLPSVATLEPGSPYALIVRHQADNTTEYRQVSTGAGTWGQVTVTSPFVQAPVEGDIYSLGIENIEHIITRAQELEIDKDVRVRQIRTEYIPAVYTQDPLPPKSARRFFNFQDSRLPLPLLDARVREETAMNRDGSIRSILIFDVTPELPFHSGIAQSGGPTFVQLASAESDRDDYYIGARLSLIDGPAAGLQSYVVDYDATIRVAYCQPTFPTAPAVGNTYTISWDRFATFGGFRVEMSDDGISWSNLASPSDTHFEMDGRGAGPGLVYFRFTPFSSVGVENTTARIVRSIQILGDLSAPAAPVSVSISSYLLSVRVMVVMQRPVAEDFSGTEIEIWRNAIGSGVLLETTRFGAPADQSSSGTMQIEATFNLGARTPPEAYGTVILSRARSVDYSDNPSAFVNSGSTTLTGDPAVIGAGIGPPSIPTGLALSTGVQTDPIDGVAKPFLDIHWNLNPESNISRYEVQYQQVGTGPLTVRMVSHPQISIREFGLVAGITYQARVQAINVANTPSGFTLFVSIVIAHDTIPPQQSAVTSIIGGFKQVSMFFTPPPDQDFEAADFWISTVNDSSTAVRAGSSAAGSIQFVATQHGNAPLLNGTTYYFWLQSRDHSGNVSPLFPTQFNGYPATTVRVDGNDVVQTTALITQFAQIQQGIIQDAHISSLFADKIAGGTLKVAFGIGVGNQVFLDGVNGLFLVMDHNNVQRVQLGRLGPLPTDYGLQIFGTTGALWHSLTGGTQTAGRQDQNQVTFSVAMAPGNIANRFVGVFPIQNDNNSFTVRVRVAGTAGSGGKGATTYTTFAHDDFPVTHNLGKTMAISPSLTSLVEPQSSSPATATLLIHYW